MNAQKHRGVLYFPDDAEAKAFANEMLAGTRFQESFRVVRYIKGYAVQLHRSGPYLGSEEDAFEDHSCRWCSS